MNKTELIEAIAKRADVPKSQAQKHFDAFEEVVSNVLKSGDEVQITGFGKFYVREQKARDGRNPQTGEKMRRDLLSGTMEVLKGEERRECAHPDHVHNQP